MIIVRVFRTFFKNWGNISQFENWWKGSFIDLNERWRTSEKMSAFSLIIFVDIWDTWHAFVWSKLLIFLRIFSVSTVSKENKSSELETPLIAFILGWFLYLTMSFRMVSEIFLEIPLVIIFSNTDIDYSVTEKSIHYVGCLIVIVNNFIIFH